MPVATGATVTDVWANLLAHVFDEVTAAEVMGNIQTESGFDPLLMQGGGRSTDPAAAGFGLQYERYAGPPQPIRAAQARASYDSYAGSIPHVDARRPEPVGGTAGRRRRPGGRVRHHHPGRQRRRDAGRRRGQARHLSHPACRRPARPLEAAPGAVPIRICTVGPFNVNTLLVTNLSALLAAAGISLGGGVFRSHASDQPAPGALRTQHVRRLAATLTRVPAADRHPPPPTGWTTCRASRGTGVLPACRLSLSEKSTRALVGAVLDGAEVSLTEPSLAGARLRAAELARVGAAPSGHTVASYERRWRQWQAFADFHQVSALPAEPMHVAAFVVARYRVGVSASGLSANLSAIGWFHARLDPPVVDVTAVARTVLRRLRGDGADKPLSPAPVLSVGALEAMATAPARLARKRSARLLRHLSKVEPRQLVGLTVDGVRVADDDGFVELTLPAVPASRTRPALEARSVRLPAGGTILDCPVEAARALVADAADGRVFTTGLLYMAHVDAYDPYDPAETTALRLTARNRALLCVGYAGALRAEELSAARVENLEPLGCGYRLRLPSTKTSRDGASQAVVLEPVPGPLDPIYAVDRWLAVRGDADGPLFGTVHHSLDTNHGMTPDELRGVLQDLAVQVGLPPTISAHSLRRSWATHTYLRDPDSLGAISLHLRHARVTHTTRYIEDLTTHLLNREQILSHAAVIAGPGGQAASARDLGFDRSALDELVGIALQSSRPGWPFAPSTLQGYASYWSTWQRWAAEHSFACFPADPRHVALFAAARAQAGIAPATLRGQLRALEAVHDDQGLPTVGFVRLAADIIAGLERDRAAPRRRAPVVPPAELLRMARYACEQGDLASLRDLVMLTVGYAGGLRVDDLHRARLEHLERVSAGYVLRFSVSKQNQTGRRPEAVLLAARTDDLDPVAAVERWRAATGLTTGPLLPSLPGGSAPARSIAKETISDRIARLAARAGCTIRPTGHSLRRSWATHAYEAGLDLLSISRQLRHRNPAMTSSYVDALSPWPGNPGNPVRDRPTS